MLILKFVIITNFDIFYTKMLIIIFFLIYVIIKKNRLKMCYTIFSILFLILKIDSEIINYKNSFISGSPYPNRLHYDAMFTETESPESFQSPLIEYDLHVSSPQHSQIAFLIIGRREHVLKIICKILILKNFQIICQYLYIKKFSNYM